MKFDLFSWLEAKTNEEIKVGKGVLRLRCSAPSPLYLKAEGHEVLAGVSTAFEIDLAEEVTFRLDAPKGVRLFRYLPDQTSLPASGETFFNLDRMPHESGNLAEVNAALRKFELQQRSTLAAMKAERRALDALRKKAEEVVEPPESVANAEEAGQ